MSRGTLLRVSARPARTPLLLLLLAAATFLASGCDEVTLDRVNENRRRMQEGGITTPQHEALLASRLASLEADLAGLLTDQTLLERMEQYGVPGVTIAVVENGRVQWVQAYGTRNPPGGEPMLTRTRLQGASLSKPVTAVAILQLVEQGQLSLDVPVNAALSSWQLPENEFTETEVVTLRRILSHTAGINNASFPGYPPDRDVPTLLDLLDGTGLATNPPIRVDRVPGSRWRYSGGAYTILQQVIEDVGGTDFDAWMRANVLGPARMNASHFEQPLGELAGTATGSSFGLLLPAFNYPELPAAGLWTNALDMARFVVALQESLAGEPGALLDAATAAEMATPQSPSPNVFDLGLSPQPGMGLGLFLIDRPEPDWFWHTGGNVGFNCLIVGDLQGAGKGIAVMTNQVPSGRILAWEIANAVADLYNWPNWDDWGI